MSRFFIISVEIGYTSIHKKIQQFFTFYLRWYCSLIFFWRQPWNRFEWTL